MNEQLQAHYTAPKPLAYAILTPGIHLGMSCALRAVLGSAYSDNLAIRHGVLPVIMWLVPLWIICRLYLAKVVPAQYKEGGKWTWVSSFLKLILPGETVRFLISIVNLGVFSLGNFLSPCSWLLTEKLYLYPRLRSVNADAISEVMTAAAILYVLFHLLYLVILYLPVLLMAYRIYWKQGEKEYEHLRAVYAEHAAEALARDAMPDAEVKVIPEHKAKAYADYNSFHGKRPKK